MELRRLTPPHLIGNARSLARALDLHERLLEEMVTFNEAWAAYSRDARPANIGGEVNGVRIGALDDEVQDIAGSYAGLREDVGSWRVARLGLALDQLGRILPAIEPAATRAYFERLAVLARAALAELADPEV